jgi:ferrochelatase
VAEAGYDALVVVSFGGPECQDDVIPFLRNATSGRDVARDRLEEVASHYRMFGGVSPINACNRALLAALRTELERAGIDMRLYLGNRNWHPMLVDTFEQMAKDGIRRALAFVTSAYSSYSGCRQYLEDIAAARRKTGPRAPAVDKLRVFYNHPGFVAANVDALVDELRGAPAGTRVLFSAHSIPIALSDTSKYVTQLSETARLVAEGAELKGKWELVYQSRSGPPRQTWLEPDVSERLRSMHAEGVTSVIVSPIGFVADHMEVVYDLDRQAAQVARSLGMSFRRAATAGVSLPFVAMIRQLVEERLDPSVPRLSLGRFGPADDSCAPDCCGAP